MRGWAFAEVSTGVIHLQIWHRRIKHPYILKHKVHKHINNIQNIWRIIKVVKRFEEGDPSPESVGGPQSFPFNAITMSIHTLNSPQAHSLIKGQWLDSSNWKNIYRPDNTTNTGPSERKNCTWVSNGLIKNIFKKKVATHTLITRVERDMECEKLNIENARHHIHTCINKRSTYMIDCVAQDTGNMHNICTKINWFTPIQ